MRILIIDDERAIADTLVLILEGKGHEAEAVYDGSAALERIGSFAPDCVISDLVFPGMSGIDVCAKIEATYPECKIFLFSGHSETSDLIENARAAGHRWELLVKPLNPVDLLAKFSSHRPVLEGDILTG
ncbi:MAG: response regulator [Terracidiphilus sp.]|jgi:DNA-binding response OmpR family regulator